jgi:hypothetical protein
MIDARRKFEIVSQASPRARSRASRRLPASTFRGRAGRASLGVGVVANPRAAGVDAEDALCVERQCDRPAARMLADVTSTNVGPAAAQQASARAEFAHRPASSATSISSTPATTSPSATSMHRDDGSAAVAMIAAAQGSPPSLDDRHTLTGRRGNPGGLASCRLRRGWCRGRARRRAHQLVTRLWSRSGRRHHRSIFTSLSRRASELQRRARRCTRAEARYHSFY